MTQSSKAELSTAINDPTHGNSYKEPSFHFTSFYSDIGSSIVPYLVNASLNVPLPLVTTVATP